MPYAKTFLATHGIKQVDHFNLELTLPLADRS